MLDAQGPVFWLRTGFRALARICRGLPIVYPTVTDDNPMMSFTAARPRRIFTAFPNRRTMVRRAFAAALKQQSTYTSKTKMQGQRL